MEVLAQPSRLAGPSNPWRWCCRAGPLQEARPVVPTGASGLEGQGRQLQCPGAALAEHCVRGNKKGLCARRCYLRSQLLKRAKRSTAKHGAQHSITAPLPFVASRPCREQAATPLPITLNELHSILAAPQAQARHVAAVKGAGEQAKEAYLTAHQCRTSLCVVGRKACQAAAG